MLSHVFIGITDFPRAHAFYDAIMRELGFKQRFLEPERSWAGWKQSGLARPFFLIGRAFNGEPATPGNGQMIALLAPSREAVDRCYARAIADGGTDEGAPSLRPHYHPNYYGAYFRDPDGNKLCVCYHGPEAD